ncbi:MAG: EamA/RhaT family transporter [Moraxellaceae bacterium]|jgi:drug/metabolite transporter (DMT)-like permease|nr:EamA/RhaT family transporter [Moraxellaceae bacterium]
MTADRTTSFTWIKLGLTAFFWALMFYLGQYAVGVMSPESIGGWRFLIAALVLVPLVALREGLDWPGLRRNAGPLLVMAVVGIGGFNVFLFHGLRLTSPVNGALIMALCPTLITVFGALLMRERIAGRQLAGLALGLGGVAVVVSQGSLQALLSLSLQRGDLFVLLAATCWAIYSTIPRRFITGLPPLQITVGTIALGGVLISTFAHTTQPDFFIVPPVGVIAAVLAMSLLGSVLAYLWWNDGVRLVGAGRAGLFMNLVPIFAMLIGVGLGRPLLPSQLAGVVLVLGGVWFATAPPAPQRVAAPLARP